MSPRSPFDAKKIRKFFPFFSEKETSIYLDTAATAQKPEAVINAIAEFYRKDYATVHRAVYSKAAKATEWFHLARKTVADFIGAKEPDDILFTKGTTESLNLVASSFGSQVVQEGDEILICETEHHANLVPWQMLALQKKAHLVQLPVEEDGSINLKIFKQKLSSKTKLVCVAHISNVTGAIHPIKEMSKMSHEAGAFIIVDGAQSVAHIPVDVSDLDCDFFAFSGHKAYGPTGVGVLYGKPQHLFMMTPYQYGGDMIENVTFEKTTFKTPPYRFEAGTPMIAEVIGLSAALNFVSQVGVLNIQKHEEALLKWTKEKLLLIPDLVVYGNSANKGGILSFNIRGIHHLDLGTILDSKGVSVRTGHLCAQPAMQKYKVAGMVRASFGMYTTFEDVEKFIFALEKSISLLK